MAFEVDVQINLPDLQRLQSRLTPAGLRPVLEGIGEAGVNLVQESFSTSTDPYGRPWQPIKRYYRRLPGGRRRLRTPSDRPLLDTGLTRASIRAQVTGRTVTIGSPLSYLRYHQGRPQGSPTGYPQRIIVPFASRPLPRAWREEIADEVQAHLGLER